MYSVVTSRREDAVPDDKVKNEDTWSKVEVFNPDLAVDTPMVIWFTHSMGPGSSVGPPGPPPGSGPGTSPPVDFGPPTSSTSPSQFGAVCDVQFHPADMPGALRNGIWMGGLRDHVDDAFADRDQHEDGGAYVMLYVGGTSMFGPIVHH
jgi:hypothetical protein